MPDFQMTNFVLHVPGLIGLRDRGYYYRGDTMDNQGISRPTPTPTNISQIIWLGKIYRKEGSARLTGEIIDFLCLSYY